MIDLIYKISILLITPVLLFILSATTLVSVVHAVEESGHSAAHENSILNIEDNDHCPACPNDYPYNTDHNTLSMLLVFMRN